MELQRTPGIERLFVIVAGLLDEGLPTFAGVPVSVIPGAWLALEGASELVPVGWREVSAALRVAGGLALIAVGVMALWWLILVSLVEPGRYS